MKIIFICILYFVNIYIVSGQRQPDPCESYFSMFDNDGLMSAGKESGAVTICHRPMTHRWYRIFSPAGTDMPTSCVERDRCNTIHPVWVNGSDSLPKLGEGVTDVQTYVTQGDCDKPRDIEEMTTIQAKRCQRNNQDYTVYHLMETTLCDSAYCFGTEVRCPNGTSSRTGFTPGCTESFPPTPSEPLMSVEVGRDHRNRPQVQFICKNVGDAPRPGVVFDVEWWTINIDRETNIINSQESTELPHIISDSVIEQRAKGLNVDLWCRIRATGKDFLAPSPFVESNRHFIGIRVHPEHMTMYPGQVKQFHLNLTIPYLCPLVRCAPLRMELYMQNNRKPMCHPTSSLLGSPRADYTDSSCWRPVKPVFADNIVPQSAVFTVEAAHSRLFTGRNYLIIANFKASFRVPDHRLWQNYRPLPLQVSIIDRFNPPANIPITDPNQRICQTVNDPHLTTFDQCVYDVHIPGEFVLYQHKFLTAQVNLFTTKCYSANIYCNCGIAVRSGRSHYIFDKCNTTLPTRDAYLSCDDENLRVSTRGNERVIEILTTGTEVTISGTHNTHIIARIKPSVKDVGITEGLCGDLDGDRWNDLQHSNNKSIIATCPNRYHFDPELRAFADSWRVKSPSESLFNRNLPEDVQGDQLCGCDCDKRFENQTKCDIENPRVYCKGGTFSTQCVKNGYVDRGYTTQCNRLRNKRSADRDDYSNLDRPAFVTPPDGEIHVPRWSGNWTEATARAACTAALYNNQAGRACQSLPEVDFDSALEQCIIDIKLMGNDGWIKDAVQLMRSSCETQINTNFSLWEVRDNQTAPSPPAAIADNVCPDDCSGHGVCVTGQCECSGGFGDVDCSVNLNAPPTITGTPGNCDLSDRPCRATPIYGGIFMDSQNLKCKVQVFELTANGPERVGSETSLVAEFIHREEIMCSLSRSDPQRSKHSTPKLLYGHGYTLRASNDGTRYSEEFSILSFDTKCVNCNQNAVCALKDSTCLIESQCYLTSEQRAGIQCQKCRPDVSTTDWTHDEGCMIEGTCYLDNNADMDRPCFTCQSTVNNDRWTLANSTCFIESQCYLTSEQRAGIQCQKCHPDVSTTDWTHDEGCMIEGTCYLDNNADLDQPCFTCQSTVNNDRWTLAAGSCFINNACVMSGVHKPDDPCYSCSPQNNPRDWVKLDASCGVPPSTTNRVGLIVGVTLGSVCGAVLIMAMVMIVIKKKQALDDYGFPQPIPMTNQYEMDTPAHHPASMDVKKE